MEASATTPPQRAPWEKPRTQVDYLRVRPLLPAYRLASGWAEVAYDWSVGDLLEMLRTCDAIDEANDDSR